MGRTTRGRWVPVGVIVLTGLLAFPASGAVKYKRERFGVDPGEQSKPVAVVCPRDTHVISGGLGTVFGNIVVNDSMPVDRGDVDEKPDDAWRTQISNSGPIREPTTAWAVCSSEMPRYRTRTVFSLGTASFRVACPEGFRAIGAGGDTTGDFEDSFLRAWAPFDFGGDGPRAARVMAYFTLLADDARIAAVCSDQPGLRYPRDDFEVPGEKDVVGPEEVQCPRRHRVLGGGAYPSGSFENTDLRTLDSFPTDGTDSLARPDDVWLFTVQDTLEAVTTIQGVAACAPR